MCAEHGKFVNKNKEITCAQVHFNSFYWPGSRARGEENKNSS